jgi:hypothetical protein
MIAQGMGHLLGQVKTIFRHSRQCDRMSELSISVGSDFNPQQQPSDRKVNPLRMHGTATGYQRITIVF